MIGFISTIIIFVGTIIIVRDNNNEKSIKTIGKILCIVIRVLLVFFGLLYSIALAIIINEYMTMLIN